MGETDTITYRVSEEVDTEIRRLAGIYGGVDRALRVVLFDRKAQKVSKKDAIAAHLSERDTTARVLGRDDIEYGAHSELPSGPNVATLDAVGPTVQGRQGKVSLPAWRAGRKPIPKPGKK